MGKPPLSTPQMVLIMGQLSLGYGVEDIAVRFSIAVEQVRAAVSHLRAVGWLKQEFGRVLT